MNGGSNMDGGSRWKVNVEGKILMDWKDTGNMEKF